MRGINWRRMILGGLLSGLVINGCELVFNGVFYRSEWIYSGSQLAAFTGLGFLTGVVGVWLYAAILPRYGAGAKTALIAGLAVWLIGSVVGGVVLTATAKLGRPEMAPLFAYWLVCLLQMSLGTVLGARVYREQAK